MRRSRALNGKRSPSCRIVQPPPLSVGPTGAAVHLQVVQILRQDSDQKGFGGRWRHGHPQPGGPHLIPTRDHCRRRPEHLLQHLLKSGVASGVSPNGSLHINGTARIGPDPRRPTRAYQPQRKRKPPKPTGRPSPFGELQTEGFKHDRHPKTTQKKGGTKQRASWTRRQRNKTQTFGRRRRYKRLPTTNELGLDALQPNVKPSRPIHWMSCGAPWYRSHRTSYKTPRHARPQHATTK